MRQNNLRHILSNPYVQTNIFLAGAIVAILIYSGIFSAASGYPIHSLYEAATGHTAPSSGLSRAFSEIVRLNFNQASTYTPYAFRIFAFFTLQLILRAVLSWLAVAQSSHVNKIIAADIIFSLAYLIYAFFPFLLFLSNEIGCKL